MIGSALKTVAFILVILTVGGCGDRWWEGSASGRIISVQQHGTATQTTIVFEDGQVESLWRPLGEKGDVLFFEDVIMKKSDSSIVRIPYDATVKNITEGRKLYGGY